MSVEIEGGVADVRLVRGDKLNALDDAMFSALIETGERLKTKAGLRAVVLSGEGRAFCAGLDMRSFQGMAQDGRGPTERLLTPERTPAGANRAQQACMVWREVPVPVVAAVHGAAFGGGLQLALGCDLRYVAADAQLSVMEVKWGLVPDMAGMLLMRGLVRDDVARELTFSGRIVSGEAAVGLGLATRVCADPHAEALAFAREVVGRSPDAIRAAKRLFNLAAWAEPAAVLIEESREQGALIGRGNQIEAVMANVQKRPARFTD